MNYKSIVLSSSILALTLTGCSSEKNENDEKNNSTEKVEQQSNEQSKSNKENSKDEVKSESEKKQSKSEIKSESEEKQSEVDKVIKNMTDEQKKIAKEQAKNEKSYGSPIYIPKETAKKPGLNKHELIKVNDNLQFKVVESNFIEELDRIKADKNKIFEVVSVEVRNLSGDIQNLADNKYYINIDNKNYNVEIITPFKIDKNQLEFVNFGFQIPKDKVHALNKQFIIKNKNNELKINL